MIRQIHLFECDSTQDVLKEQLLSAAAGESVLVSCENQTAGRGRGENKWTAMEGTLCFSLNILPNPVLSFTAIELAVIVAEYFADKNHKLLLKWPNDLWNAEGLKCGGILVQGNQMNLLAGIGLNLWSDDKNLGGISATAFRLDKKSFALEIAQFIHSNRISDRKVLSAKWLSMCGHLNQMVRITEGSDVTEGIFQGIGDFGEALVCRDGKTEKIYNGSLRLA